MRSFAVFPFLECAEKVGSLPNFLLFPKRVNAHPQSIPIAPKGSGFSIPSPRRSASSCLCPSCASKPSAHPWLPFVSENHDSVSGVHCSAERFFSRIYSYSKRIWVPMLQNPSTAPPGGIGTGSLIMGNHFETFIISFHFFHDKFKMGFASQAPGLPSDDRKCFPG